MNGIRMGAGSGTDPDNNAIREIAKHARTQGQLNWVLLFLTVVLTVLAVIQIIFLFKK